MTNFKLGIIGIGQHFKENLLPNLLTTNGFLVDSIYSSNVDKALYFKDLFRAKKIFNNWKNLIDESKVDAVIVTGSPDFHQEVINYIINKKIYVFVEKPPLPDFKSLKLILKNRDKIKKRIFVGYSFRHSSSFNQLKEIVEKNDEINYLNFRYITNKPRNIIWNCKSIFESFVMAVGIHPIEMVVNIFKNKPKKIVLQYTQIDKNLFSANVLLNFNQNKNAVIEMGNYSNKLEMEYKILNKKGEVGVLIGFEKFKFYNFKNTKIDSIIFNLSKEKYEIVYEYPSTKHDYYKNGYGREIELFYKTVKGEIENPSSLEDSYYVYYIIDRLINYFNKMKPKN